MTVRYELKQVPLLSSLCLIHLIMHLIFLLLLALTSWYLHLKERLSNSSQ